MPSSEAHGPRVPETEAPEQERRVEREVTVPADREEVWEALTDPALLRESLADDVELDLHEGGSAVFRYESGEERRGKVERLVEGESLRLRWERAGGGQSDVELVLADALTGTRLRVVETSVGPGPTALAASNERLLALGVLSISRRQRGAAARLDRWASRPLAVLRG